MDPLIIYIYTKTSHLTVTDEGGKILARKGIATMEEELIAALGEFADQPIKAVLEAGYNWGKMYDWLSGIADEVILAHPQNVIR